MTAARCDIESLLHAVEELAPKIRAHASEADRLARLPEAVVRELLALRLFRLWIPERYGGFELELSETLRVYEAAACVDGSFGWATMIGAGGGLFAAYLDPVAANDIYAPQAAVIAGSGAPTGQAEHVADGYRVSGRWRYASGAHYATTFTANCIVTRDGQSVVDSAGNPVIRAMAFASSQVTIHRNWNTVGMRGTGSHDFEVRDVFVPAHRTFSVFTDSARESGPLYRLPFGVLTELPIAAVGLGIARHALDAFNQLSKVKRAPYSSALLDTLPGVQTRYLASEARWRATHNEIHALARRTWEAVLANRALTSDVLANITAHCVSCMSAMRRAVDDLAAVAGMSAIEQDNEFARAWRDLQTLSAHAAVSPLCLMPSGEGLLS